MIRKKHRRLGFHLSRISRTSGLWSLAPKLEKGTSFSIRFRPFRRLGELASRNFLRRYTISCSGAISDGHACPSISHIAEYPVALEINLQNKPLPFGCYGPDLIEPITANSLPPRVAMCYGGTHITSDNFPAKDQVPRRRDDLHGFNSRRE